MPKGKCKHCDIEVNTDSVVCPQCGSPITLSQGKAKEIALLVALAIILAIILYFLIGL